MRTRVEDDQVQAKDRGLREANLLTPRSQPSSLGTVRSERLLFKPPSLCHSVTAGLETMHPHISQREVAGGEAWAAPISVLPTT